MTAQRHVAAVTALALTLAGVTPLLADEAPTATQDTLVGRRVRIESQVRVQGMSRLQGRVLGLEADHLLLHLEEGSREAVEVPLAQVLRLEIYGGSHRETRRGAIIGALVGAASGFVVGYFASDTGPSDYDALVRTVYSIGGAAALGGLGTGLGAAVGSGCRVEEWDVVAKPRTRPVVFVVPQKDGVRVALALRF